MAEKKNQHFVPKVHLKQFATDTRKRQLNIWLPKLDKIVRGASIRDQCSKNYFYGDDLESENFFNLTETKFGQVVEQLKLNKRFERETPETLLFLWLFQHIRAERMLLEQVALMSKMHELLSKANEDNKELQKWLGEPTSIPEAMKMALDSTMHYIDTLSDLRCVLLINETKTNFILSDNPAVSSNKYVLKRNKAQRNWGMNSAGFYLFYPLTPNLGFLAYDRHIYELLGRTGNSCTLKSKDIAALNQLVYLFSKDLIVLPPNGEFEQIIKTLKCVEQIKPDVTHRINFAVEDDLQESDSHTYFKAVSEEDLLESKSDALFHFESLPPNISEHFPKLRIRQNPRYIETNSGAGRIRYGCKHNP